MTVRVNKALAFALRALLESGNSNTPSALDRLGGEREMPSAPS
jgi:hypothetical protein